MSAHGIALAVKTTLMVCVLGFILFSFLLLR
jgi:hypothetical protein